LKQHPYSIMSFFLIYCDLVKYCQAGISSGIPSLPVNLD
jgi:hypothetical protein